MQLRDKHLDARTLVERGRLAAQVCAESSVPFILNDRPDLALEIEADGVHVGQDDASPALARRIMGPTAIVGLSTHAPEELEASRDEPVDYVSAGPVTPTPTKPGRPGTGTSYITFAVAKARTTGLRHRRGHARVHPVHGGGGGAPLRRRPVPDRVRRPPAGRGTAPRRRSTSTPGRRPF